MYRVHCAVRFAWAMWIPSPCCAAVSAVRSGVSVCRVACAACCLSTAHCGRALKERFLNMIAILLFDLFPFAGLFSVVSAKTFPLRSLCPQHGNRPAPPSRYANAHVVHRAHAQHTEAYCERMWSNDGAHCSTATTLALCTSGTSIARKGLITSQCVAFP